MSATAPPPPAPGAPRPAPPNPARGAQVQNRPTTRQVVAQATRSALEGTPGTMRLLGAIAIVACLLFGVLAYVGVSKRADALAGARADAAQLVRVQAIRTNLVAADANLTNAFLVGGLEPAAARAAYTNGISSASKTLAVASGVNADDAVTLQKVNDVITTYTGLVEAARSNNRQGYPIGAAYLRQATNLLRDQALPVLERLVATEEQRVDDAYSSSANAVIFLVVGLVLALVALTVLLGFLAVRTRRWINVPIAVAAIAVLAVGLIALVLMGGSQHKANNARQGPYRETVALATARIDAFDAKSAESLTLIARGSGDAYDKRFDQLAANARLVLSTVGSQRGTEPAAPFEDYLKVHAAIRQADQSGNYDRAVQLATAATVAGSRTANATFASFDKASAAALADQSSNLRDELGSARTPLLVISWVALLVGLLAAVATYRGVSTRLREYR